MRDADSNDSEDDIYADAQTYNRRPRTKRRKANNGRAVKLQGPESFVSLQPLLDLVEWHAGDDEGGSDDMQGDNHSLPSFESIMNDLLPEYIRERKRMLDQEIELDVYGQPIRPLMRSEVSSLIQDLSSKAHQGPLTTPQAVVLRKLKLQRERRLARIQEPRISTPQNPATPLTPLPIPRPSPPVNPAVIDALYSIKTTPYRNSFASRVYGTGDSYSGSRHVLAVDWETHSQWMELMADIKDHYSLAHPDRDQPIEQHAPITYGSLLPCHLYQVHDLLARTFWTGIDSTLCGYHSPTEHSPEKCTVIATYKRLVVGVAIISSPQEMYITYLAVRAGWENSQIATSMLYHLIQLNPNKDVTLHVSANNPAMLLYNRFGFKAEEFVAGFYEDYLDPQSRASKNAFRLRLRR